MKKYNHIVYIGRFQPLHNAHAKVIELAGQMADNVIVVCGSSYQPRTLKNPFTDEQRAAMIKSSVSYNINVEFVRDTIYNNTKWAANVQQVVESYTNLNDTVAIIGCDKDESSFYLEMFPQWEKVLVDQIEELHASAIRDLFFNDKANLGFLKYVVPSAVFEFLAEFHNSLAYEYILNEKIHMEKYRIPYNSLPYEVTFVTADAVVIQSGHVLMVKRKASPGKGLWALPGGFLDAQKDRSMKHCMLRELTEETGIKLSTNTLERCITDSRVFDAIGRSARGRTITHAFKLELKDGPLVHVKGSDDAEKAKWIPISSLNSRMVFEDHYEIIQTFVGA